MSVARSFFSLSSLTLVSRVSGFIKVAAFAAFYGRSAEADMFLAVMILPDLLYRFLSEGLVSSASVPLFVDLRNDKEQLEKALFTISWIALLVSGIFAIFLSFNAEDFCRLLTPGFDQNHLERMKFLWALMSVYLVTGTVAGVFTSFLNAQNYFALPAIGPLLVNIAIIAAIFIVRGGAVEKIALAVIIGSVMQLIWLIYLTWKYGYLADAQRHFKEFDVKIAVSFVRSVFPVAAWISVLPFIPVYERYLLSMQPVGSVAALNYIEKLFNLPLGILSISLARVILPELSRLGGADRRRFLFKMIGMSTLVILPVVVFSVVCAESIVEIVFKRGRFSVEDTVAAAGLFASYSFALLPTTLCMIFNRGFFAARKYHVPFLAGLSAAAAQFYLGRPMVEKYGVNGIGYAAAIAFSVQLLVLFFAEIKTSVAQRDTNDVSA
ncbi:MAG: putative peptidoglycan lipid flippase [Clostridiales bacterium]|nr:putative peptidoglycan lipid flippase [Clostridiales bacterium]MDN5282240.1 putative peptidoglycan lipid flippase [Candidatus Ozemobacter sp.]